MARTKSYDIDMIIEAIDKYFFIENYGNPKELIKTKIAMYLNKNGFPNINDRMLNRDIKIVEHIEKLKIIENNESNNTILSYTPIIVDDFLKTNSSISQLKKALTLLDKHYEDIYQLAITKKKEATKANNILNDCLVKNNTLISENEKKDNINKELKKANHELESEIKKYRNYIKETMLPELANEILKKDNKLFNNPKMVTDNGYEEMVIDDSQPIEKIIKDIEKKEQKFKNNVISGLFESLE